MSEQAVTLFCLAQVSPATARVYGVQLRAFVRWLKTQRRVPKIERATTADILAYKQALACLAASSQARIVATVRAFYRWALAERIVKTDPAANVRPPRALRDKAPTYISLDETRRLLASVDTAARHGRRDLAILWALSYGLRIAEVCALDVGDVIPPKDGRLPALQVRGKGSKARAVPLSTPAYAAIAEHMTARGAAGKAAPLFTCQTTGAGDKRLTQPAVRWLFSKYCERVGIDPEKRHPHAARHGFATRLLFESKAPGGILVVSKLLGHSSVSVTQVYLHCDRTALDTAIGADVLGAPDL